MSTTKYKFSVIISTYNTPIEKIKLSIKSVMEQEFESLELIISDDASERFNYDEIKNYIQEYKFYDYTIIKHEKNIGTVRNFTNAIKRASGKYIKGLGGGDLLYDKNTIKDMYQFLEKNSYELCFGRARNFCLRNGEIRLLREFKSPKHKKLYNSKYKNILSDINILLCHDWISGIEIFGKRETMIYFLEKLIPNIKYREDGFQILAIAEKKRIQFFDRYIAYYEWGDGISTKAKNNTFKDILKNELKETINISNRRYKKKIWYRILLNIGKNQDSIIVKIVKDCFDKIYT